MLKKEKNRAVYRVMQYILHINCSWDDAWNILIWKIEEGWWVYVCEGTNWVGENRYKECKFTWRVFIELCELRGDVAWN